MIDWKKVAQQRQKEIKYLRGRFELLGLQMQQELHRTLVMQFHARCFERAGVLADQISLEVTKTLTGKKK